MTNPLVSICCQTYNHVKFIEECLQGFLMQKTNFDFEILLRDDASTDGTSEICKKYAELYPDKINLLIYAENQYQKGVKPFFDNVKRAKGKYIAICEGDDYWTDPLKLQKQVDFLEQNSTFSICTHKYQILAEGYIEECDSTILPTGLTMNKSFDGHLITNDNYWSNWVTQPLTALIRTESLNSIDFQGFKYVRDIHLFYLLLQIGNGICFPFVGGVYRKHYGGIHSGMKQLDKQLVHFNIYEELYVFRPHKDLLHIMITFSIYLTRNDIKFLSRVIGFYRSLNSRWKFYFIARLLQNLSSIIWNKMKNNLVKQ